MRPLHTPRTGVIVCLLLVGVGTLCIAFWIADPARADINEMAGTGRTGEALTYASPVEMLYSHDGTRLFVANTWDDTISVIDTGALEVIATWPVSAEPSNVLEDREGKHLFVAN